MIRMSTIIIMLLVTTIALPNAQGVPVLIKVQHGHIDEVAERLKNAEKISLFDVISADLSFDEIKELMRNEYVEGVYYDVDVRAVDDVEMLSMPDLYSSTATTASGDSLWNLQSINVSGVWEKGYTGEGIRVAVIDTGVSPHEDFGDRIVGFRDFINNKTQAYDDNGHGTHVAGIVAGAKTGVAPHAEILAVKVLDQRGSGRLSTVLKGIEWAYENGADIISMSLGALPGIGGNFGEIIAPGRTYSITLPVYSDLGESYSGMDNFLPTFIKMRVNPDTVNYVWAAPPYGGKRTLEREVNTSFTLAFNITGYANGYFSVKVKNGDTIELLNLTSVKYNSWEGIKLRSNASGVLIFESYGDNYIWLDDIDIAETGFHDDVENGNAGWTADGWYIVMHTLSKSIPEGFRFHLVTPSGSEVVPECEVTEYFYDCRYSSDQPLEAGNWTLELINNGSRKVEIDVLSYVVYPSDGSDVLSQAVNDIVRRGVTVVVAAGNAGELGEKSIASPGSAESAITVGAVDRYGKVAYFSSRGPVGFNPGYIKPDVVAPGVSVVSTWKDGGYASLSGTSMATPHVTGIAALLLQLDSELSPLDIKRIIETSANDLGESGKDVDSGSGSVDAYRAMVAALNGEVRKNQPPVVKFSVQPEKPVAGETVIFKSESYDPDGKVEWVKWEFGDGSSLVAPVVTHTYSESGNYTLTVTVCDDAGLKNTTSAVIHVYEPAVVVEGFVANSIGRPVHAVVTAGQVEAVTDDRGYYTLEVPRGTEVLITAEGYSQYSFRVNVSGMHNITLRDVTPPILIVGDVPRYINTTSLNLSVTALDNETGVVSLRYFVDGREMETGDLVLSEGEHIIKIVATDYDGNEASRELEVTVDTLPPELRVVESGWSNGRFVVVLSSSENVTLSANCNFQVTKGRYLNVSLDALGCETAVIVARDNAGNIAKVEIEIPPPDEIELYTPSGITNKSIFSFRLPTKLEFTVYVDGNAAYSSVGEGDVTVKLNLKDGEHIWWVEAAGLSSSRVSFVLDTSPPSAVHVDVSGGKITLKASEELARAVVDDGRMVREMEGSGEVWTCTLNVQSFTITMVDLAGNIGTYTYTHTYTEPAFDFICPTQIEAGSVAKFRPVVDENADVKFIYWTFGDGRWWLGFNADHTYRSPGVYTVTMYVFNNTYKLVATVKKEITVN